MLIMYMKNINMNIKNIPNVCKKICIWKKLDIKHIYGLINVNHVF